MNAFTSPFSRREQISTGEEEEGGRETMETNREIERPSSFFQTSSLSSVDVKPVNIMTPMCGDDFKPRLWSLIIYSLVFKMEISELDKYTKQVPNG